MWFRAHQQKKNNSENCYLKQYANIVYQSAHGTSSELWVKLLLFWLVSFFFFNAVTLVETEQKPRNKQLFSNSIWFLLLSVHMPRKFNANHNEKQLFFSIFYFNGWNVDDTHCVCSPIPVTTISEIEESRTINGKIITKDEKNSHMVIGFVQKWIVVITHFPNHFNQTYFRSGTLSPRPAWYLFEYCWHMWLDNENNK